MKFFISKYALSTGVFDAEMEYCGTDGKYAKNDDLFLAVGVDAHLTEEACNARAEQMRIAKISSIKKQLAKLEKMTF